MLGVLAGFSFPAAVSTRDKKRVRRAVRLSKSDNTLLGNI